MELNIFYLVVISYHITQLQGAKDSVPFGEVRNCPSMSPLVSSQPLYQMEVLPGIGYDNLRSIDMGQVLSYNYSQCQISKDGKYLLPDGVFLIPVQQSSVDTSAEYFNHWDNYSSAISFSIGIQGGVHGILNAKFSTGYTHTKLHMYNQDSKMTRAQIRYRLYTVKMQPGAQLHPAFKARLYDIAAYLQNNDIEQARFLSETIIRDFGTHCITSMDAGAIIMQESFIRKSYTKTSSNNSFSIAQSASAVLSSDINLGLKFSISVDQSHINSFLSHRVHSKISTIGGPPYQSNFSLSDWEAGVADSLVAIDRSGVPLHNIININTLPELPPLTIQMLSDVIYEVIERYHRINKYSGCTDPNAENFEFQANINQGCDYTRDNFTFGGIFQNCTVDPNNKYVDLCTDGPQARQHNPLTGDFSCPINYFPVKIYSGKLIHTTSHVPHKECHRNWHTLWIKKKCKTVYSPKYSIAYYDAYWCAAHPGIQIPDNSGYLFGGLYTSKINNPITNTNGCPQFFIPLHMGMDIRVCVSDDYERASDRSVPFAGFQSCEKGNPLAASTGYDNERTWPHECPVGYAQHLVSVENGCEINYCVQLGSFASKTPLPPNLPPFHKHPKHKLNNSDMMILVGVNGGLWAKDSNGKWVNYAEPLSFSFDFWFPFDASENDTSSAPNRIGPNNATVAVASVISTLSLGMIIALLVFISHCVFKRKRDKKHNKYMEIEDTTRQIHDSNIKTDAA